MSKSSPSRRAALLTIAAAGATAAMSPLAPQHESHAAAEGSAPPPADDPIYFNTQDYATVTRVADLIIPKSDTPGALAAGVPFRIDRQVAVIEKLQPIFNEALKHLSAEAAKRNATSFVALSEPQQIAILTAMSDALGTPQGKFFTTIKDLTVDWYYRSEQGLVEELGFKGNTFRAEFPGCTHPEHWPEHLRTKETV